MSEKDEPKMPILWRLHKLSFRVPDAAAIEARLNSINVPRIDVPRIDV